MKSRIFWAMTTGAVLLLAAAACAAQEIDPQTAAAKAAFAKGKALVEGEKYAEAADAFREANRLQPTWKLFYNIGQCEMMAKRHALALEAFERYLSEGGVDIAQARRDEVLGDVVRLREMVGFADVKAPDGAIVSVDNVERGSAPLPGPITVDAGVEHQVLAMQGNAVVINRVVRVSGGQTVVVELGTDAALAAEEAAPAPEPAAEPEPEEDRSGGSPANPRAVWGWTATGVGAALLVAGAVTGGLALSKNADVRDNCPDGNCPPAWHDDVDARDRLALSTNVLLGVGAGVAIVGVLLLTVFRGKETAAVSVSSNGVAIEGRF
jgi:hypothetical protein